MLRDLAASAEGKGAVSGALQRATLDREASSIDAAAAAMAQRFADGGRLFTFGNGGSSTDAASLASLFARPPWGAALPARCLADDTAVLTALANDVGFDLVFSRQLIAHAEPGDIALGISTSGNSRNLLVAFDEAARRGLLTIGIAGYDGGEMAASEHVQHCLVVRDDSVHRVQETQAAVGYALWNAYRSGWMPAPFGERGTGWLTRAAATADAREAAVLDRITEFRRRRPRLRDDVITLAHGAGGKASAALVDAVFLEAFTDGEPQPLPDAATLTLPTGERLAFSTDSFVVKPLRFPGGSIGHLAVHGTVNDLAVQGAQPAVAVRRRSSSKRASRWPSCARSWPTWPKPLGPRACRSSPATPRSSAGEPPTVCSSPARASA